MMYWIWTVTEITFLTVINSMSSYACTVVYFTTHETSQTTANLAFSPLVETFKQIVALPVGGSLTMIF